jgi:hypothetical protein
LLRNNIRDTILLSGWLFADLLLGLMVIFMVSIPGAPPRVVELLVTPGQLDKTHCTGAYGAMQCEVQLTETGISQGSVNWTAFSDINNSVTFTPSHGTLKPGQSVNISIGAIPCQDGAFIFRSTGNANAVLTQWSCTQIPERLERNFCRLVLDDHDPDRFSQDAQFAVQVLKPQINRLSFLKGRQVGIAIVSGGVDDFNSETDRDRGSNIAKNAYYVLQVMGNQGPLFQKTSYYTDQITGFYPAHQVVIDIYLVIRPDNAADTCNKEHVPV